MATTAGALDRFRQLRLFAPFEIMLAGRYLRARRKESFISVIAGFSFLGIAVGVATLIIVMAVMNGFRKELLTKFLGLNGHVVVQAQDTPLRDYAEVTARFAKVPGVAYALPIIEGQALASSPFAATGALVRGVRPEDLPRLKVVAGNLIEGSLDGFNLGEGVLVGRRLAQGLSLRSGDQITLVSPRGAVTPMGTTPRIKSYPIAGVFEIGMSDYDNTFVFMPFSEAQSYFNRDEDATGIEIYLDHPDSVDAVVPLINEAAERQIVSTDWRRRNVTFFSALEVERNVMFLILALILVVAALNIISGLIMLVTGKQQDIAILRTMGASRGAVMRIFLMTGATIGIVGTLLGFLLAILVCWNIESIRQGLSTLTGTALFSPEVYFLSQLPAELDATQTAAVVLMALALSFLASLYPAWRAASLDPVEALRYG